MNSTEPRNVSATLEIPLNEHEWFLLLWMIAMLVLTITTSINHSTPYTHLINQLSEPQGLSSAQEIAQLSFEPLAADHPVIVIHYLAYQLLGHTNPLSEAIRTVQHMPDTVGLAFSPWDRYMSLPVATRDAIKAEAEKKSLLLLQQYLDEITAAVAEISTNPLLLEQTHLSEPELQVLISLLNRAQILLTSKPYAAIDVLNSTQTLTDTWTSVDGDDHSLSLAAVVDELKRRLQTIPLSPIDKIKLLIEILSKLITQTLATFLLLSHSRTTKSTNSSINS